jgi:hypothetical protein
MHGITVIKKENGNTSFGKQQSTRHIRKLTKDQTKPPRTRDGGERLQMDAANAARADNTDLEGGSIALEQEGGGEGGSAAAGGGGQGGSHW